MGDVAFRWNLVKATPTREQFLNLDPFEVICHYLIFEQLLLFVSGRCEVNKSGAFANGIGETT